MVTNKLGADYDYSKIVLDGPIDLQKHFEQERKVKAGVTVYPGRFVSGNGETEGEIDLAAAGDGIASFIEIVLHEAPMGYRSAIIVDGTPEIDRALGAGKFVTTLRQSNPHGGLFKVVCWRADESSATELGEMMALEADGMCKTFAYTDTAQDTDLMTDCVGRCANVTADEAGDDISQEIYF
ncbi:MAG: hypothetical protein KAS32_21795 [Candidatus Peribacteraceae bacterium]|nr:hypothetical protein [Candidatus Peribacteraceae bacterium]